MKNIPIVFLLVILLTACTMPKIVIFDDPLTAQQHNDLGVVYEEKGDLSLAAKEYEKAIKKNRDWVIPYLNLGHLYYRQGKLDQSERILREGIRIKGDHPDLLNNLAWVMMEKGELKNALYLVDKAIYLDNKEEYRDTRQAILEKMKKQ